MYVIGGIGSGVATGGGGKGHSAPLDREKFAKNCEKEGVNQEIAGKRGKKLGKRKNRKGSFTLPLLTDRAGYATGHRPVFSEEVYLLYTPGISLTTETWFILSLFFTQILTGKNKE